MSLGAADYMAYQVSLAAKSFIQIPVTFGDEPSGWWYQKLRIIGEDSDVSFSFAGVEIDPSDGSSHLYRVASDNPGAVETTLVQTYGMEYSGLLTIANRNTTTAKWYSFGIERVSST